MGGIQVGHLTGGPAGESSYQARDAVEPGARLCTEEPDTELGGGQAHIAQQQTQYDQQHTISGELDMCHHDTAVPGNGIGRQQACHTTCDDLYHSQHQGKKTEAFS